MRLFFKTFIAALIFNPTCVLITSSVVRNIKRFRKRPVFLQDLYIWLKKDNSASARARRIIKVMRFLSKNNKLGRLSDDHKKVLLLRTVSSSENYGLMGVEYIPSKKDRGKKYITFRDFQCDTSEKLNSYGLGAFDNVDSENYAAVWVDIDDIEWANPSVNKVRCWRFQICVPNGYWDFENGDVVLTPQGEGKMVVKTLKILKPFMVEFDDGSSNWFDVEELARRPK